MNKRIDLEISCSPWNDNMSKAVDLKHFLSSRPIVSLGLKIDITDHRSVRDKVGLEGLTRSIRGTYFKKCLERSLP